MPLHVIKGVPLQRGVRGLLAGSSSVSVVSRPINNLCLSLLSALLSRPMEGSPHRTLEEIVQVP